MSPFEFYDLSLNALWQLYEDTRHDNDDIAANAFLDAPPTPFEHPNK